MYKQAKAPFLMKHAGVDWKIILHSLYKGFYVRSWKPLQKLDSLLLWEIIVKDFNLVDKATQHD